MNQAPEKDVTTMSDSELSRHMSMLGYDMMSDGDSPRVIAQKLGLLPVATQVDVGAQPTPEAANVTSYEV